MHITIVEEIGVNWCTWPPIPYLSFFLGYLSRNWFEAVEVLPDNIWVLLDSILSSIKRGKKIYNEFFMVWHAVVWVIWCIRVSPIRVLKRVS
jgi:hypothetical protein